MLPCQPVPAGTEAVGVPSVEPLAPSSVTCLDKAIISRQCILLLFCYDISIEINVPANLSIKAPPPNNLSA